MKRLLLTASLVLIPAGLFLGAWQSYSYYELDREVSVLEKKQQDLIESNKRLIAQIASDTSARVVESRAENELGMAWPKQDQIVKLVLKPIQNLSGSSSTGPAGGGSDAYRPDGIAQDGLDRSGRDGVPQ